MRWICSPGGGQIQRWVFGSLLAVQPLHVLPEPARGALPAHLLLAAAAKPVPLLAHPLGEGRLHQVDPWPPPSRSGRNRSPCVWRSSWTREVTFFWPLPCGLPFPGYLWPYLAGVHSIWATSFSPLPRTMSEGGVPARPATPPGGSGAPLMGEILAFSVGLLSASMQLGAQLIRAYLRRSRMGNCDPRHPLGVGVRAKLASSERE